MYVITADKATADALTSAGLVLINSDHGKFTFMWDKKLAYATIDRTKITVTNRLHF